MNVHVLAHAVDSESSVGLSRPLRHDRYWLEDGSIILRGEDKIYKVHRTLIHRHSRVLPSLETSSDQLIEGLPVVTVPGKVKGVDLEALLQHLYHDAPLSDETSMPRVACLLRVTSEEQLDFPALHALARRQLEQLYSPYSDPVAFKRPQDAEEALALAVSYDIPSIRKLLYYTVATHPHEDQETSDGPLSHPKLSPELYARCDALLEQLVSHFTPILFTVATAGHMTCTDAFAEKWMLLVIQPALDDNGLCRPLETLDRIIAIDWAAEGLCAECVKDKAEEWRGEQRDVWDRMDEWLS